MTRPSRRIVLALAFAACAGVVPASAHEVRSAAETYVGVTPAAGSCRQENGQNLNIAATCFPVLPIRDWYVQLRIVDFNSPSAAFHYLIHNGAGNCADMFGGTCRSAGYVCNSSPLVFIPGNATGVRVTIVDPALATAVCALYSSGLPVGAGANGRILATFYD